jgi:Uma2 family endonuclease
MTQIADLPGPDGYVRKKWTVRECCALVSNGLLTPGKFELIEGEIIFKMGQGRAHIFVITRIIAVLAAIFGIDSIQTQAQFGIGELDAFNDPEPDVTVLRGTVHDYLDREPNPATEALLVVEAANTSLVGDMTTKARIYAKHGIAEYWVVAIPRRELIVYRDPRADGYADIQTYGETVSVSPLAAPNASVQIADLLP